VPFARERIPPSFYFCVRERRETAWRLRGNQSDASDLPDYDRETRQRPAIQVVTNSHDKPEAERVVQAEMTERIDSVSGVTRISSLLRFASYDMNGVSGSFSNWNPQARGRLLAARMLSLVAT